MHISHFLALAASCAAAVLPRDDEPLILQAQNLMGGDLPSSNLFVDVPVPTIEIVNPAEMTAPGRIATEAPPGEVNLEARDILGGVDDRVQKPDTGYPWSAMGRILINAPGRTTWCSGSLIGPRHVLTARHCILDGASFVFSPSYFRGDRYPTSYATHVLHPPGTPEGAWCNWRDDWAILRLNEPIGNNMGYLGFRLFSDSQSGADIDWWTYGYPQDRDGGEVPYAQNRFKMSRFNICENYDTTPLGSTADAFGGQSGSPVWIPEPDGRYQYGVVVAITSEYTLVSNGPALLNAILQTRQDWQ